MFLKIVVAGPKGSGKTIISNFLSNQSESLISDRYDPTAGVRILEFELRIAGITDVINIQLWDSSGDPIYEKCWKAIMFESDGVLLVYNPEAAGQDQQINDWFDYFVKRNGLKDEQCVIFAHKTSNNTEKFRPPPLFSKVIASLTTNQSGQEIKNIFENFMKDVCHIKARK
mmetsp:Transcript_12403/g.11237  ORF Transcript_12403/g.11237 Transcript_12403/m.11237 type:complete len:171 (+) Transcript_12403:19-531(+)